jgi:hypothetical protein
MCTRDAVLSKKSPRLMRLHPASVCVMLLCLGLLRGETAGSERVTLDFETAESGPCQQGLKAALDVQR